MQELRRRLTGLDATGNQVCDKDGPGSSISAEDAGVTGD